MGLHSGHRQPPADGDPADGDLAAEAAAPRPAGVPPPPPCWCGRALSDHATLTPGHDYAPSGGIESEASDTW